MGKDIPLGRIAGIKVGMNVSVFLFAAFLAVTLATTQLPALSRGHGEVAYWVAGLGGALFLFLSLLVHEIGHALVAQDEGIRVQSMGLTLLGGVTRMESSPTTPGAEFRVSVVGPIASACCGVVFLVGSFLLPNDGLWDLVGALFFWAGYVNIFLAVLNLFPAAPLDGGKVLSSVIWRATGSQATAMIWSGAAGIVAGMDFKDADAIVLGCAGMSQLRARVEAEAWRLRIVGSCAVGDPAAARNAYDAYRQRPGVPKARRDAMARPSPRPAPVTTAI